MTYSFLAFMKSIFHFCLGCYCGGYSQNGRSNLSSCHYMNDKMLIEVLSLCGKQIDVMILVVVLCERQNGGCPVVIV